MDRTMGWSHGDSNGNVLAAQEREEHLRRGGLTGSRQAAGERHGAVGVAVDEHERRRRPANALPPGKGSSMPDQATAARIRRSTQQLFVATPSVVIAPSEWPAAPIRGC